MQKIPSDATKLKS